MCSQRNGQNKMDLLIDALNDRDVGVRQQAIMALRRITRQFLGFEANQHKAERDQIVARWRDWWKSCQPKITEEESVMEEEPAMERPLTVFRLIQDRQIELIT